MDRGEETQRSQIKREHASGEQSCNLDLKIAREQMAASKQTSAMDSEIICKDTSGLWSRPLRGPAENAACLAKQKGKALLRRHSLAPWSPARDSEAAVGFSSGGLPRVRVQKRLWRKEEAYNSDLGKHCDWNLHGVSQFINILTHII